MSVSFDWDFREEEAESLHQTGGTVPPDWRRRWLFRGLVLLILLVIVGVAAGAWIKSRVDLVEKTEAELRGAVELELKTIVDGDAVLFRDRQDPRDSGWAARQIARYVNRPNLFAPAPGLMPADRSHEINEVHVQGGTGRAELTHWFVSPDRESGDLSFHTTWFYRQDDDGVWYHVAPPADYWGVPYSWHGTRLVVQATEAEASALDPVARELAILVANGCRRLACPDNVRYSLSFDGELGPRVQGNWWTLPALYLTGLPEDDQARAAWERALKLWVVEALAQAQTGAGNLSDRVMYRQLVRRLQTRLGLPVESGAVAVSDLNLVAEALREGRQHAFQGLWEAEAASSDPEELTLLEAEAALLLRWIQGQVGDARLFELLPALGDHERLDAALMAIFEVDPLDFEREWLRHLAELTGVTSGPVAGSQVGSGSEAVLELLDPPPAPPLPPVSLGNQIAFICDSRVWVGNGDGSNLVPLTARDEGFAGLYWSPDGRWLLTTWLPDLRPSQPSGSSERRALYVLAADGSGGRLLTDNAALPVWATGWDPDGRQALYYAWTGGVGGAPETWAADVQTRRRRQLAAMPLWSPDGQHLVYATGPPADQARTVWLAGGDWENPRPIVEGVILWPRGAWSSDSTKIAGALHDLGQGGDAVVVYDLETERLTPVATLTELVTAALAFDDPLLGDGMDASTLDNLSIQSLWTAGWSADGRHLAVWVQWERSGRASQSPTALVVVPLDGSPPRALAYMDGSVIGGASWSPGDPDQLTFSWLKQGRQYESYLFDLQAGPIYTATQDWIAAWSPDGAWVAFAGHDQLTIVDQTGQARFSMGDGASCSAAVWSPVADLSGLGRTPALVSSTAGWSFANVRIHPDPDRLALHVEGELVNYTGGDRRITDLIPAIRTRDGNSITPVLEAVFPSDYVAALREISLADGHGLPLGLTVKLPPGISVEDVSSVSLNVVAEPGERTRDDLNVSFDDYDLSAWPDHLEVRGIFDNPGEPLDAYVMIAVTAYDQEGQVIGWGWSHYTQAAYLMGGGHFFVVDVPAADFVPDLGLDVGSYKIHIVGR
jgi:Tol biopolymer transport system component